MLKIIVITFIFLASCLSPIEAFASHNVSISGLNGNHDLSLPDWGPYTKNYIGISHISDKERGIRFDLSVFPGLYRRKVNLPNVNFESDYHPWEASSNLHYFSFRHDIEWKDRVYADISYSAIDEHSRLIKANLVNNTDLPQSLVLHMLASIHFPSIAPYSPDEALQLASVKLPKDGLWIDAVDYHELTFQQPRASDGLVYDGWRRGEIRAHHFVNGKGIGKNFGKDNGDTIEYKISTLNTIDSAVFILRYRNTSTGKLGLYIDDKFVQSIDLAPTESLSTNRISIKQLTKGKHSLKLVSETPSAFEIDGFALVPSSTQNELQFIEQPWQATPEIISLTNHSVILKYPDINTYYGIRWFNESVELREILQGKLEGYFEQKTNDHNTTLFKGDQQGHYTNLFMRPINLAANSQHEVFAVVTEGNLAFVKRRLKSLPSEPAQFNDLIASARKSLLKTNPVSSGEKYRFSQQLLNATLLTNIVFPVYTQGQYIRHSTPGRWWDSLYTWDSGFIGIGLLNIDTQRSIENLNAYLTEPSSQSAFIHHGTPLPVQHYQFLELWNRTQSIDLLRECYPKLKRYYDFLAGNSTSSQTRPFQTQLINTWAYFYNSGGWDDYPAQSFVHKNGLSQRATPVVSTAHLIRAAKILTMAAETLELEDDAQHYRADIAMFTEALQKYSWNEKSGYFSYVVHNTHDHSTQKLTTANGENFNRGLDGVSPLVSGITTPSQTQQLINHLKNPKELLSPIGLSAVDQSASYYRDDGYWNGTVWMPHQWFMWKSLLDQGEPEFAFTLAQKALDLWKQETEATYNSFEHFVIATGRGAGWHQFGGLSSPIADWFASYYLPGSLTGGFNLWITHKTVTHENSELRATLRFYNNINALNNNESNKTHSIIVVMNEGYEYHATIDNRHIAMTQLHPGAYTLQIPHSGGELVITPRSSMSR